MPRHYLVDGYNVILQDSELDTLLDQEGLSAARHALRQESEAYARQVDCRIRLIYDGAVDTMSHLGRFESERVEDSFTTREEKADERLVALALEYRRKGLPVTIVSDDREGIRVPLESAGFQLLTSAGFARLLRSQPHTSRPREKSLSERDQSDLAQVFLARDAEMRVRAAAERAARPAAPPPATPAPPVAQFRGAAAISVPSPAVTPPPRRPTEAERSADEQRRVADAERVARKERGARKQARRLELQRAAKNRG